MFRAMVSKIFRTSLQEYSEQRNNSKKESGSKKRRSSKEDSKEDSETKKRRSSIDDSKEESETKKENGSKKRRASRIEEWMKDPTQDPMRQEHKRRAEKRVEKIRKRAQDAQEALRDAESLLNLGDEDKKDIIRAKVVIKKAMLKKMERSQVEKFLASKGVRKNIIDQAYKEIMVEANNTPDTLSIEYYKKLSERNAREASDAAVEIKQLKRKIKEMEQEITNLRGTVTISVQILQQINQLMYPEK